MTEYLGTKMPRFYIGSSSVDRVEAGYKGSVCSKKFKQIWKSELKDNPNLFKTKIIEKFNSREEALQKELQIQIELNVVKDENFINQSLAKVNGFFGCDTSGKNNGFYGKTFKNVSFLKNGKQTDIRKWQPGVLEAAALKRSKTLSGRNSTNSECVRKQAESHNKLPKEIRKQLIIKRNNGENFKNLHIWLNSIGIDVALSSVRNIYVRELKRI